MKSYKRLLMWQKANELVLLVYKITNSLTSQLRRAVLSVVLNIIEGYARRGSGDLRRFLDIALGCLAETEYLLELATDEKAEKVRSEWGKLMWFYRQKVGK